MVTGESIADYRGFDFRGLWAGRDRVTAVEQEIVRRTLATTDRRRVLEVGSGFGRLLPTLLRLGDEVVACDFDADSLGHQVDPPGDHLPVRVAGNLYHLPFADQAFTSACMIRVYHHLSDPVAALSEVGRVLQPGGRLLLSYNPRPSLGTFAQDVRRALRRERTGGGFRSVTFARERVVLPPDPFPVHVGDRAEFEGSTRTAGFSFVREVVAGLEEFRFARHAPVEMLLRLGFALGDAPLFPVRFVLLSRPGEPPGRLAELRKILACPRCHRPLPFPTAIGPIGCEGCGHVGERTGRLVDLRYVPQGVPHWSASA